MRRKQQMARCACTARSWSLAVPEIVRLASPASGNDPGAQRGSTPTYPYPVPPFLPLASSYGRCSVDHCSRMRFSLNQDSLSCRARSRRATVAVLTGQPWPPQCLGDPGATGPPSLAGYGRPIRFWSPVNGPLSWSNFSDQVILMRDSGAACVT